MTQRPRPALHRRRGVAARPPCATCSSPLPVRGGDRAVRRGPLRGRAAVAALGGRPRSRRAAGARVARRRRRVGPGGRRGARGARPVGRAGAVPDQRRRGDGRARRPGRRGRPAPTVPTVPSWGAAVASGERTAALLILLHGPGIESRGRTPTARRWSVRAVAARRGSPVGGVGGRCPRGRRAPGARRCRAGLEVHVVEAADATARAGDLARHEPAGRRRRLRRRAVAGGRAGVEVGDAAVRTRCRLGAALLASEQLGVAQWCLETTVAYLQERRQFGRVVGGFQALKHRLADLYVLVEQAACRGPLRRRDGRRRATRTRRSPRRVAQAYCADVAVQGGRGVRAAARRHRHDLGAPGAPVPQAREGGPDRARQPRRTPGRPGRAGGPPALTGCVSLPGRARGPR